MVFKYFSLATCWAFDIVHLGDSSLDFSIELVQAGIALHLSINCYF